MFGMFFTSDSLVGQKLPENSKSAVEALFSRRYNVRSVSKDHWTDDYYTVKLYDGKIMTVRTATGYTLMNQPYTYIRSIDII